MVGVTLVLLLALAAQAAASSWLKPSWGFAPTPETTQCGTGTQVMCGPDRWVKNHPNCGKAGMQSPIDAPFKSALKLPGASVEDLVLTTKAECKKADFELTPYTTEVVLSRSCPGAFVASLKGKAFDLLSYRWHSPSEHMVDGRYYPMEVQHVFRAHDGQFLIIAVFIDADRDLHCIEGSTSPECVRAEFFNSIQALMPMVGQDIHESDLSYKKKDVEETVDPFDRFIPPMDRYFYTYNGSFTTPSCDTNVVWILNPIAVTIFDDSLQFYRKLINSFPDNQLHVDKEPPWPTPTSFEWNTSWGNNNRPIQALYDPSALREFFVVGDPPGLLEASSSFVSGESGNFLHSARSSSASGEAEAIPSGSGSVFVPFGSSGFHIALWKWILVGALLCCCLAFGKVFLGKSAKKRSRSRRLSPRASVEQEMDEEYYEDDEDEDDDVLPPLVPITTYVGASPTYAGAPPTYQLSNPITTSMAMPSYQYAPLGQYETVRQASDNSSATYEYKGVTIVP